MKPEELKRHMKGVQAATVTPFKDNDEIDFDGLKRNIQFLTKAVAGKDYLLTPLGSMGEFNALNDEEHREVMRVVVREAGGKIPVIPGVSRAGTRPALEMAQFAEKVGADGVMVVLPYYAIPNEEGMYQHYRAIAEGVSIGVIIYNNAAVSGSWIKPPLMARLSEIENIIAVKECTPHFSAFYQMHRTLDPAKITLLCGQGEQVYAYASAYAPCKGFTSIMPNFAPCLCYQLYEAGRDRDFDQVRGVADRLSLFLDFTNRLAVAHGPHTGMLPDPYGGGRMLVAAIKEAMNQMGLCGGKVRLPYVPLRDEEKVELREILVKMGLSVR